MTIISEIALADLLAMILGRLVHPALSGVGERILVRARRGPAPEKVLALVRALLACRVLHVTDVVRQVISPLLSVAGEVVIPLERLQALALAAVVLDVKAGLLVRSHLGTSRLQRCDVLGTECGERVVELLL